MGSRIGKLLSNTINKGNSYDMYLIDFEYQNVVRKNIQLQAILESKFDFDRGCYPDADIKHMDIIFEVGACASGDVSNGVPLLLSIASNKGDYVVPAIEILLKRGADINVKFPGEGNTALHFARRMGNIELEKFLVASGADINLKNKIGEVYSDLSSIDKFCADEVQRIDTIDEFSDNWEGRLRWGVKVRKASSAKKACYPGIEGVVEGVKCNGIFIPKLKLGFEL